MTLYKIVLGGNSNCGKTELLPKLAKYLVGCGYYVLLIPESATELLNDGLVPAEDFQVHVPCKQRINEDNHTIRAWKHMTKHPEQDVVMLLDRSFLCQRAYTPDVETWVNIMNKTFNLNYLPEQMNDYIGMCKVFVYVPRQEKIIDKLELVKKACMSIINKKE